MKKFTFLAKQGQHNQIARILTREIGKPKLTRYSGPRGNGVMITLSVPSKRATDRLLHSEGVAGSVSRACPLVISGCEEWEIRHDALGKIGYGVPFRPVLNGKFLPLHTVEYKKFPCDCCGGIDKMVPVPLTGAKP